MTAPRSTDIRDAWQTSVWSSATVSAMTPNVFLYQIPDLGSDFEAARLYHDGAINFFQFLVTRASEPGMVGQVRYTFNAQVDYYLQQTDSAEDTQSDVIDRLEAVDELVLTSLGPTWGDTVSYYAGSTAGVRVSAETIDGRTCWRGQIAYRGFKTV